MGLDTRTWNIIPLALLFASGCQTASRIPLDEGETGTGSGDGDGDGDGDSGDGDGDSGDGDSGDGDGDSGDGDGDSGEDWCDDDPCPEGWLCISFGSSGYCYPECYDGDGECDLGEACFDNSCASLDALPECEGPTLVELPIPEPAQGEVLDLSFGDLDDDGTDELLVLHPGELVIVQDADAAETIPVDPLAEAVAALDVNDDGDLDVVLSSTEPGHVAVLLGNGDQTVMAPAPRMLGGLAKIRAIDWPAGGADELVGIDAVAEELVSVSSLDLDPPTVGLIDIEGWSTNEIVDLHPGDFDADGVDDLLVHDFNPFSELPRYFLLSQLDGLLDLKFFGFNNMSFDARSAAFPRPLELGWGFVFTLHHGTQADIHVYFDNELDNAGLISTAEIRELVYVRGWGLALATADDTKLVELDDLALGCVAEPEQLPAGTRVLAAEFADNPGDELVLLDDLGQLHAWGQAP